MIHETKQKVKEKFRFFYDLITFDVGFEEIFVRATDFPSKSSILQN